MANFIPKPYKTEQVTIRLPLDRLSIADADDIFHAVERKQFIAVNADGGNAHAISE